MGLLISVISAVAELWQTYGGTDHSQWCNASLFFMAEMAVPHQLTTLLACLSQWLCQTDM